MLSDEKYNWLAEQSYWVENARDDVDYHPEPDRIYYYSYDKKHLGQFQVLSVEDNTTNGMQAMAVAPIVSRIHFLAHKSLFLLN